jgi:filamentous hemagglutinin
MKTLPKIWRLTKNFLAQLALISLVLEQFIFISTATAQTFPINPDGTTNTQVTQTASGVDQVNIAAPNANGLSHNKFTDYNVNTNGQVINNFSGKNSAEIAASSGSTAVTATQIGGLVTANSNLASSGSAKVILNEVTFSNASQLLGYTEIAGTKADLILANPNGIACRGCGFINTARLFMVAGSSNFDSSGNLGFNLKEQTNPNLYVPLITIDGLGLDVSRTSSTDIIASSVKLLSTIYGSDNAALTIKTGEGRYDYAAKNITGTNVQNNTSPVFAIDASSLAQIQAGQVYLIATKQGVGVNMETEILASSTVNIDANGDVYYSKISAGDAANLTSTQKIQSTDSNSLISAPTINVTANEFKNLGLASAYNLNIQNSGTLNNAGSLEALSLNLSNIANINNSGSIYGENSLSISGTNLTNNSSGSIFSPQSYSVVLTGLLTNSGLINSGNNLSVTSNQLTNSAEISAQNNLTFIIANSATNSGNLIAGNALNLTATSLTNSGATQSGGDSNFNLASLTNSETASIYSAKNLALNLSSSLTNSGEISSLGNFAITGTSVITNLNQILSNSDLSVIGSSLNNSSTGIIASLTASLNLALTGDLQNDGEFDSTTDLTASAANFTNSGNILGNTNLILSSTNSFTNSGNLQSGNDTSITTSSLDNSGLVKSLSTTTVNADTITNQTSGVITSADDLTLTANAGGLNNSGAISSQNNFTLISSILANSGTIYSANSLGITNSSDLTNSGTLYSDGSLSLLSNNITNSNSGGIFSTTNSSLTSLLDFTNAGNLQATTDLNLNIGGNSANSGVIVGNHLTFINAGDISNSGSIGSDNNLTLSAANLTNSGLIQNLGDAQINLSGNLTNQANASIYSGETLGVTASGSLENSGEISAVTSATFNVASLINSSSILANNDLIINSASVQNQSDATLASISASLTLNLSDYLTNAGTIFAKENLTLANLTDNSALNSVNNSGDISFDSLVDGLLVKDFANSGNFVSTQDLTITSTNSFANSGAVNSTQNLALNNTSLNNSGEISAANNLTVTASADVINSGNILANGALTIGASNFTNNESAAIASLAGALTLTLTNDLQNNGQLSSSADLNIGNKNLTNVGDILSGNKLTVTATNAVTNSGNFQSISNFSLISASLDNSGAIKSFGTSSITASSISNQTDALIFSNSDSSITSSTSFANSGSILSNGKFDLTAALATNSNEIFSTGDLTLTLTNNFSNSGSLSSLGKIDISSTSSITNTNQILSGGNLSITATSLNNSSTIKSNSNLTLNLASLTNSNNIVSGGTFNITASGNIANSSNLQSTDNFTINAASFTNSASSLILAGKDLTVRASSITNQNTKPSTSTITSGIVSANGNILLQTDTLNNNSGIIAGKSTTVNALNATSVNLYNTLGAFISTAVITLDLGALDYTITGTVTADNVDITASNITNQGNVTASDYIKLNATGVSGSGNITNGFARGDNSKVQLAAGTYVDLTAKNNINNYGTISANNDLTLTSTNGQINNYKNIIGGNGETTINVANSGFTNVTSSSVITSNNDLTFNTRDLTNSGEISVANNLTAKITNNLYNNPTALIWSGNDATFNVANSFVNNQSDIYANNNLTIQKNASLDALLNKASLVQNISGNIETYAGDIIISASTLTNQRSSMKTQSYIYWQSGCNFHNHECHYDSSYTASASGTVGANSSITSGSDLSLKLGTINNNSASILAVKDVQIDALTINNTSNTFESYQNRVNDWWGCCNPYNWLTTYKPSSMSTESYSAFIKSGGSLTVTQNGSSNPSFINASNVTQYSSVDSTLSQLRSTTVNYVDSYTLGQTGVVNIDLSSIANAISENGYASGGSDLSLSTTSTSSPTSVTTSSITKGSISNPTGSIDNSSVSASSASIASSSLSASGSSTVFSGNFKINLDSSATTPLVESRSQFTDISKFFGSSYYFNQLGLNGSAVLADIDRQTRNTTATRILGDSFVETKLILDQLKSLTNDSLFLSKNTTDSNQQIKELLDNSIAEFAHLGLNAEDVAIHGLTTAQANSLTKDVVTFETTKVNGISVLTPKIYLSQDTRNRLLNTDGSLATNATLFAKTDLTIDSPLSNMTNSGSIVSGGNLTLNVGTLTNASSSFGGLSGGIASVAKIKSGGDLTIISNATTPSISGITLQNSIIDTGGKLSLAASNNISITNDKNFKVSSLGFTPSSLTFSASSIKDDATTSRSGLAFNAASDIQITSLGNISIANNYFNTGGSIFMTASNDINNSNYTIKASDNVVMFAGNNINNIQTTANSNETRIEAGNIVSLDAGNDINNIGATIKGGSLVYLTAGNDINNEALVKYTINGSSTNSDGSAITESQALASSARYISSNLVSQGNIESGGNLVMVAANDINNKGSNITSTGASYLEATNGNINITTAALRDKTFAEGGSRKKHWVSITDNITNVESNITSGGSLDLVASGTTASVSALASEIGNINITGSSLTSANNLTLTAKNDLNIKSAQDTTYSFAAGRTGRGKSYLNQSNSTTQIGSELATTNNGNISITSGVGNTDTVGSGDAKGSISLIASKLTTKDTDTDASNNTGSGNITLAAKENLTISSALNTKYSESYSSKKGMTVKKSSTQIDGSATNVSSELDAAGDITTTSGNDTNIIASNLTSAGSGSITSGGETNIFNGVDTTTHYSNVVKENKGILSQIPVVEQVFQVVDVILGGLINGISGGNWNANGTVGNSKSRVDATSTTEKIVTSNLNFANDLSINSDQDLVVRSSNLTSTSGDISLTSNLGNVSITAATANNTSKWFANNKTDRSKAKEEIINNTGTATSSEITAGNNITITSSEGSALLQAAKLTSGTKNIVGSQDITVSATNGNIYLLAANDTSEVTHIDKSKGTYSFSNGASGQIRSAVINNEIRADGGNVGSISGSVVFDTTNQILAQYKNIGLGNDVSVFVDDAKLSYLNSLDPTKTNFSAVNEIHADWDQTTRGLTGAAVAAIVVAAVVISCVLTGCIAAPGAAAAGSGGGAAAAGASTGATAATAATATTATAVTAATTTTLASASLAEIAAAAGSAALTAGATTATTTATISAINASMNADGDIFKQLKTIGTTSYKDTTSTESLRNIAIAAAVSAAAASTGELIKNTKINYNNSITPEQAALGKESVSTGQSNLMPGSIADSKIGINSYYNQEGLIIKSGTSNQRVGYLRSSQNAAFKSFGTTPGAPSFADFHDALNLSSPWNELSIPAAYAASQFNALTPYYPIFINYETKEK